MSAPVRREGEKGRSRSSASRAPLLLALLVIGPAVAGCTAPSPAKTDIVASFYPVRFLVDSIAGGRLSAMTLVSPGVEPHDYELKPSDVGAIEGARLVAYHGAGLEVFEAQVKALAAAAGVEVVEASRGVDRQVRDLGEEGTGIDAHMWLDPVRFKAEAANVGAAVQAVDPGNASFYATRFDALDERLAALDREFAEGLGGCTKPKIITTHASFGYMADRYGFTQYSITGFEPDAEPSAEKVRAAADLARRENITVIFFETLVSPKVAKVVADEIHGTADVLDPVEGLTEEGERAGSDYISLMRRNLAKLRDAMGCT